MFRALTFVARFALGTTAISLAALLAGHLPGESIRTTMADATFTVDSAGDGADSAPGDGVCAVALAGPCTLRAAIQEANATPGRDTIAFDLGQPRSIAPTSPLPSLTSPAVIDGTTQPGFRGNPLIELDGSVAGETSGLVLAGGDSVVKGLVINRFSWAGIHVFSASNVIQGNHIGTDLAGVLDRGNGIDGIHAAGALGIENNLIGGTSRAARNLISGNDHHGVQLGPGDNRVQGNFIGTDFTGSFSIPNSLHGISACGCQPRVGQVNGLPLIGGPEPGAGNLVSGNRVHGISGAGVINAQGNRVGTNDRGNGALGNGHAGIAVSADGETGAYLIAQGNIVAYNGDQGIVADAGVALGNSIYSNGGPGLSIDNINNDPVLDPPALATAFHRRGRLTVRGSAHASPGASVVIELFANEACDPSGFGEGKHLLRSVTLTTDGAGDVSFDLTVNRPSSKTRYVTATMTTDPSGRLTSNFSNCLRVSR